MYFINIDPGYSRSTEPNSPRRIGQIAVVTTVETKLCKKNKANIEAVTDFGNDDQLL